MVRGLGLEPALRSGGARRGGADRAGVRLWRKGLSPAEPRPALISLVHTSKCKAAVTTTAAPARRRQHMTMLAGGLGGVGLEPEGGG